MKAKVLIKDVMGRWVLGEIGEVEKNNFDKYDYFICFPEHHIHIARCYYFYKDEVELLNEI